MAVLMVLESCRNEGQVIKEPWQCRLGSCCLWVWEGDQTPAQPCSPVPVGFRELLQLPL